MQRPHPWKILPFFLVAALTAGFVVFRLPYFPNEPIGVWIMLIGFVVGVVYWFCAIRRWQPTHSFCEGLRFLPLFLTTFTVFWGLVRATLEPTLCLQFSEGWVTERYVSNDHGYLAIKIHIPGQGTRECKGLSQAVWDQLRVGSQVRREAGTRDVIVLTP